MADKFYKFSQRAQGHLKKIREYTLTNYSEPQWQAYKQTLTTGFELLANNPSLGRSCDDIYQGGLYFPVGKHAIYYIQKSGFILIVAVLGQAQLPEKHLLAI